MIRLLKRIKLSQWNAKGDRKLLKYIPYALGEIILITVGLLLALQINNRNQLNGDFDESTEYLEELMGELNRNLDRLNYLKKGGYTDSWFVGKAKLDSIGEILDDRNAGPDMLFSSFHYLTQVSNTYWAMQRSIYLEGVNTGKLSNLETEVTSKNTLYSNESNRLLDNKLYTSSSNNLKVHIHFYYGWMDKRESAMRDAIDSRKIAMDRCGDGLFILDSGLNFILRTYYDGNIESFMDDEVGFKDYLMNHDWIKDRSSSEFKNALYYYKSIKWEINHKAHVVDEFLELTENLISLIEKELEQRI